MLNIIIKELKELLSDKRIWIGILTVLIIIIIGTSYNRKKPENTPSELLTLGVINYDESVYSDLLLTYFSGSETFSSFITVVSGESAEIKEIFQMGELDIYLEIPEDFAQNMVRMEHSPLKVTINIKDTTKAILFQNILKSYEKYIAAVEMNAVGLYEMMEQDGMEQDFIKKTNNKISIDMIFTALGKESFFSFRPVDKFPTTTVAGYYIISVLVMTMMYASLYVGYRILREINQGTFMRLRTTRIKLHEFLTAKMLLMVCIITVAASIATDIINEKRISVEGILFCFAISLFCVTLAVFLSTFFDSTQRYILAANLFLFYCTVIGGGIIPIRFLPQAIVRLSKLTPNYYMMKGIILYKQGQSTIANQITLGFLFISLLLYILVVFLFSRRSVTYEEA